MTKAKTKPQAQIEMERRQKEEADRARVYAERQAAIEQLAKERQFKVTVDLEAAAAEQEAKAEQRMQGLLARAFVSTKGRNAGQVHLAAYVESVTPGSEALDAFCYRSCDGNYVPGDKGKRAGAVPLVEAVGLERATELLGVYGHRIQGQRVSLV